MRSKHLKVLALALALGTASSYVAAQDFTVNWNPRSGDVWIDQRLGDINTYGVRYREPFINEMVGHYGAPRDLVSDLLIRRHWAPGDVYYACSIAHVLGVPCRNVVDEWDRSHGQGWGVVAQRMGIKPGSAQFHQLKRGFVPTYDRWGRTIVLDRDLERAYPNRGKVKPMHPAPKGKTVSPRGPAKAKPAHSASPKGHADHGGAKTKGNGGNGKAMGNHGGGKGRG